MFTYRITDGFLASLASTLKMKLNFTQGESIRLLARVCDLYQINDVRQVAYILATCYHECLFISREEIRAPMGTSLRERQNKYWGTGFYGRGFVQLTWETNYKKFSPIVGLDLVKNPELALEPKNAAIIMVSGMQTGSFTGHSLSRYFPEKGAADWTSARRIVNGTDQAERIAEAAKKILSLLVVGNEGIL